MRSYTVCKFYYLENFSLFQYFFYTLFIVSCYHNIIIGIVFYKLRDIIKICLKIFKRKSIKFNNFIHFIIKKIVKSYLHKTGKLLYKLFKNHMVFLPQFIMKPELKVFCNLVFVPVIKAFKL